ncbi:MAG: hypothetical protein ACK56I_25590, partial [bacterium]
MTSQGPLLHQDHLVVGEAWAVVAVVVLRVVTNITGILAAGVVRLLSALPLLRLRNNHLLWPISLRSLQNLLRNFLFQTNLWWHVWL